MRKRRKKSNYPAVRKFIIAFFVLAILGGSGMVYELYSRVYQPNIVLPEDSSEKYIYIPTGADFLDVIQILSESGLLVNANSFRWVANRKNYINNIKAGRYFINRELNNNELINLLRSGEQIPVKVTFNNLRTKEQLAGKISAQIEADSIAVMQYLMDTTFLLATGLNTNNVSCLFIPNTYEFYWNTSAKQFVDRMQKEYNKFWNKERLKKAAAIGLTKFEVSTLAAIVEMESYKKDERPIIAQLYLNRLKKRMKLQSDPTIIFAIGDFTIRRVLTKDLKIESPYNTYLHKGLPPGPICIPSVNAIDAVLNATKNNYLFMCAKEDFSGYHNFAKTSREHSKNARKYRRVLNKRKIMR